MGQSHGLHDTGCLRKLVDIAKRGGDNLEKIIAQGHAEGKRKCHRADDKMERYKIMHESGAFADIMHG